VDESDKIITYSKPIYTVICLIILNIQQKKRLIFFKYFEKHYK